MAGILANRLSQNLATGSTASVYLFTMKEGKKITAVVNSDQAVTFWITYGRASDNPDSLPFSSVVISVPAGETRGLSVEIMAGTEFAKLTIDNASGSTAAIVADCGTV